MCCKVFNACIKYQHDVQSQKHHNKFVAKPIVYNRFKVYKYILLWSCEMLDML
jgi:hypothetical protein